MTSFIELLRSSGNRDQGTGISPIAGRHFPVPCSLPPVPCLYQLLAPLSHILAGEAEVFQYDLARSRRAEAVEADHVAFLADVLPPAQRRACLDRDLGHGSGQNAFLILRQLLVEDLPAG